jgi:hypothetical protein
MRFTAIHPCDRSHCFSVDFLGKILKVSKSCVWFYIAVLWMIICLGFLIGRVVAVMLR